MDVDALKAQAEELVHNWRTLRRYGQPAPRFPALSIRWPCAVKGRVRLVNMPDAPYSKLVAYSAGQAAPTVTFDARQVLQYLRYMDNLLKDTHTVR